MGILYVVGQRPGAGSTAVSAALATVWLKAGRSVALLKPAALSEAGAADAELFASVTGNGGAPTQAPTVVSDPAGDAGLAKEVAERVARKAPSAGAIVVEGLPLTDAQGASVAASAALAQALHAQVLGVLPYSDEPPAETAALWRRAFGDRLAGVVINRRTRYAEHEVADRMAPQLREAGVPVLGVLPEERLMLAPTVRQVADHLGAPSYLGASQDHRLVEHILIGGLIRESGSDYFGRFPNQAVVVKATRPDIAMAALSCPLSCLILTGGAQPNQYVLSRAEAQGVPLLVVETDTLATAAALESLQERVSVHHPQKVERFALLLEERLDWGATSAAAGLN